MYAHFKRQRKGSTDTPSQELDQNESAKERETLSAKLKSKKLSDVRRKLQDLKKEFIEDSSVPGLVVVFSDFFLLLIHRIFGKENPGVGSNHRCVLFDILRIAVAKGGMAAACRYSPLVSQRLSGRLVFGIFLWKSPSC